MPDVLNKAGQTSQTGSSTQIEDVPQIPLPEFRKRAKPPRSNTVLIIFTLIFSLFGAISGGFATYLYWQSLPEEIVEPEPSAEILEEVVETEGVDFLVFGDYHLSIYTELDVNSYDLEAFGLEDGIVTYPDARLGVDVSQYQGDIDWEAVAADGVSFAIIRLGYRGYGEEGNILLDEKFHQNMTGAQAAGLDVGVYFFSQATSVWETMEEAYFVLDNLEGYELDLPVVFDWEFISYSTIARTNGTAGRSITLYNQVFNQEMEAAGYDCMIYFNQSLGYLYLDLETLSDYPFWLASYRDIPNFHYHFDIWQYSETGSINGIEGNVDLNLMFADYDAG